MFKFIYRKKQQLTNINNNLKASALPVPIFGQTVNDCWKNYCSQNANDDFHVSLP